MNKNSIFTGINYNPSPCMRGSNHPPCIRHTNQSPSYQGGARGGLLHSILYDLKLLSYLTTTSNPSSIRRGTELLFKPVALQPR